MDEGSYGGSVLTLGMTWSEEETLLRRELLTLWRKEVAENKKLERGRLWVRIIL